MLVKLEINVLTYRQDKGIEHAGLERVWECEPNWDFFLMGTALTFDEAECGTKCR